MAIDLGSWLRDRKKQLEGAVAQVNPLDNGKTYNTVVNNRPPVQPVQRAQPVRQVNQQQPGWSVRRQPSFDVVRPPKTTQQLINDSYGTGFTSVANRLKDVINRDTKADQIKRQSQSGLNESYDQQQERLNNAAYNNPDKRNLQDQVRASVSRNVATIFNKAPGAVANLYGSAMQTKNPIAKGVMTAINPAIGLGTVFGGKKSQKVGQYLEDFGNNLNKGIDNRIQQGSAGARKTDNRWVDPIASGGVQVAGNILAGGAPIISQSIQSASNQTNQARAKGRTDEQALGIGAIQGLVSYGSERIGMDKLLRGGGGFVKKVLTEGAQEAQQQFTENAITNQLYDKTQGFLAGVPESFVGGLAGGTLGASSSRLMSNSQEPTNKLTPQVQPNIQRARPEEYNVLSDYQDVLHGNIKNPTVINQTIQAARQAGQRLGLDVTSGSVSDINQRINEVLSQPPQIQQVADPVVTNMPVNQMTDPQSMRERIRAAKQRVITPLNEGGYITNPLPGKKPTPSNIYGDNYIKSSYNGQPITTDGYMAEFDDVNSKAKLGKERNLTEKSKQPKMESILDPVANADQEQQAIGKTDNLVVLDDGRGIQSRYLNYFEKKYGDISLFKNNGGSEYEPIKVMSNGKWVGVIMPIKGDSRTAVGYEPISGQQDTKTAPVQTKPVTTKATLEKPPVVDYGGTKELKVTDLKNGDTVKIGNKTFTLEQKTNNEGQIEEKLYPPKMYDDYYNLVRKDGKLYAESIYEAPAIGKDVRPDQDPLESLKQEARKYKSAEEFVRAINSGQTGAKPATPLEAPRMSRLDDLRPTESGSKYSVKDFDQKKAPPLKVDSQGGIRDGHNRWYAAKESYAKDMEWLDNNWNQKNVDKMNKKWGDINFPQIETQRIYASEFDDNVQQLTDLYNQATQSQPPKSTPKTVEAKPPTPFEQNLQTAGLAPKKAKGLVVSETKPLNGQKIQKVRTGKGQVEQRLVQDRSSEIADALGVPQDQRDPSFNAVAAAKNSSSAKRLVAALNSNEDISQAAAQAQQDGKEINFFAKKDANGRSVGVERFNPKYHKIEAGFVTDRDGNVLGNHIKVDATGVQVNVGGDLVNMESVLGNPNSWRNKYETSSTMERNIYKNAPTKEIADKTYKFIVAHKIQSEANFKTELSQQRKDLAARTKATMAAKPRKTSDTEYKSDMFDFIENNATYTDMVGKYGQSTAKVMSDYKIATRTMYNDLLERVNEKFQQFGIDPVPQRKDYLTHINELMNKQSYIGELAGQLQNSITGEGSERTRGAVPGDIAGRTENFKPTKKWNKFFQERKGGEFTKDPFKAVDAYLEPTLHNIHMTESGVRTRAVEAAFRTAAQLKAMDTSYVTKELDDSLAKFKVQGNNDKLIRGFQEYANAITGKTQAWDRQVIDSSEAGATTLRGWQKLQGVAGRATILGNANSVLMQPLNQVATLSQVGPSNYLKGLAASVSGDKSIKQSPFITARQAKADSNFKTRGQRVMDAGGVPLEMVEMASVKATWHAQHQAVIKDGYKGQEAIIETDRRTERTVAGRGIADKPELYRSTLANGVLQYTLEVNAQNKMFMRDLTPKQKATFLVATLGVNSVLGAVTGNTPLPDFLKAAFDSIKDFADGEEGDSVIKNVGQTAQRFAGEAASMNPLATGAANLLPKGTRQALFGKESALGRYEGTSAPIQVIKNAVDAGSNLVQGKYKDARNSALKDIPFGNQIQKTVRGAEAIADGKTEGSPWQGAKALAFGPNAISTDTAKADRPRSSTSSTSKGTVNAISVGGKTTSDLGDAGNVDNILKAQFSTKEQQKWLALTAKEREAEAKQDPEKAKWLKQYEATKRVNKDAPDLPDGISDESKKILEWHDKRTAQQKEKLAYSQNDYDYKLAKANYEKDTLNGTISRAEQINRKQSLKKAEIGTKFTKDTRESYNSLSKAELQELAANDENGQKIWDDALAYGDELVKAGIIKKNKLRSGSRGKGGRKGTKKGKGSRGGKLGAIDFGTTDLVATNKRLQALLGGTTVKPVSNKKVTVKKPKLKKVA